MPSIAELRSRLAKAQTKASTARLSKSQCIDILLKVCQKRNITLVPTLNGDELLTLKQLEKEVLDAIDAHDGRVTLAELAATIGVQRNHVDRIVEKILQEHPDTYISLQDTLITTAYTEKLMLIANSRLQECGLLDACDFANEFELPFDMIKVFLSKSKVVEGKLNGNLLESHIYDGFKERCVLASLSGTTVPTSTTRISNLLKIDVNFVNDVISRALKSGCVCGVLKGGVFTPKAYSDHRNASLLNFYNASGYLERSKLTDSTKSNKESGGLSFQDAVTLETVIINRKLIEPVVVLINEAIANDTWTNIGIMLPAALTNGDITALIDRVKDAVKSGYMVEGLYVSNNFESAFLKHVVPLLKERYDVQMLLEAVSKRDEEIFSYICTIMDEECVSQSESPFSELWSIASQEFYNQIQDTLLSQIRSSCTMDLYAGSKSHVNATELTEQLKSVYMKFIQTIKGMEDISKGNVDNSHLIMKTMVKELMPTDCHTLLHLYASQNHISIPEDAKEVNSKNRIAIIDCILDQEVKSHFKLYVEALKQKDALKCVEASKSIRAAMYITCNVKNEKKGFIRTQLTHYKQKLASLTHVDPIKVVHCVLNIALQKNGHYIFLVDKDWCIKGCIDSLEKLVNDDEIMGCMRKCLQTQGGY
ncbi:E3 UFM1-protein ligase 1 like protein [Babesia gibsoni]|uniref:E3 UFM1-protein ligase 1 like protein n=1 Tax=Babesia gibsoni TaxID=33632 RepID=A0AAD8PG82_BABGI|nr:E3 UFM1-protein ligase 1 like protein [Babesia gibsoni]